ncbi:MAG: hydrogenase maturation nickel metallochaperone HypA [Lachnospiraceae bacterium]|nr:hydrogenase maturation nickel metallochaperone HypA [Lachnospiraceae bacterium]MEE3378887.1 hydrogenase maturation nickel metallochaperone HypA [Lachnospiraceae bacterium]MEE3433170.1 hydrogenase maturation nickel metallochaperone HypA [Lachnospiraceae bacterium]
MHELSYMSRMVGMALDACKQNQLTSVESIEISVGETTGLVPHFLEDYYPECVKGTLLEGSKLYINFLPVTARCMDCGEEYKPGPENEYSCPMCRSIKSSFLHGREFTLDKIIGE